MITLDEKLRFLKTQAERDFYLNEYKENVALALTVEQLTSGIVYPEILEELTKTTVKGIKLRRDIPFHMIKPYILEAEKKEVNCTLIDALNLRGNIGLVVVSKEPFDNNTTRTIIVKNVKDKFKEAGLSPEYQKSFNKKLCEKHYDEVTKIFPEYKNRFKKIGFFDKILGEKCPICKNLNKK